MTFPKVLKACSTASRTRYSESFPRKKSPRKVEEDMIFEVGVKGSPYIPVPICSNTFQHSFGDGQSVKHLRKATVPVSKAASLFSKSPTSFPNMSLLIVS